MKAWVRHQDVFDTLRILAALSVIYWHSYALTGHPQPVIPVLNRAGGNYGSLAVGTFFAMSGYLIASSWRRKPEAVTFIRNRLLRIYPALIVCVVLTAVLVGPIVKTSSHYFSDSGTLSYVVHNATLYREKFVLPGVFTSTPYPQAVNGSLWTLPFEMLAYVAVLVAGLLGGLRSLPRTAVLTTTALLAFAVFVDPWHRALPSIILRSFAQLDLDPNLLLTVGSFFACGVLCSSLGARLPGNRRGMLFASGSLAIVASVVRFPLGLNVGIAFFVVCLGTFEFPLSRRLRSLGDPSYGAYIYAFPIQQLLADSGLRSQATMFVLGSVLSLVAGYLSWHLLESRVLNFKARMTLGRSAA